METIDVIFLKDETIINFRDKEYNIGDPSVFSIRRETSNGLPALEIVYPGVIEKDHKNALARLFNSDGNVIRGLTFIPSKPHEYPLLFNKVIMEIAMGYEINLNHKGIE